MSNPNNRWESPVEINFEGTGRREVQGPFEALAHLTDGWPSRDASYIRARSACRAALGGHKPLDEARKEFQAAVEEARKLFERRRH